MNISFSSVLVDQLRGCLTRLLPETSGLQVHQVQSVEGGLVVMVKAIAQERTCPVCGSPTTRVQSWYQRTLQDLPWAGVRVQLRLHVRRFFCLKADCPRRIFTEPLPDLAQASARRTNRLRDALLAVGWALGGEEGLRLCRKQAMPLAASTLLGLLRRFGGKQIPTPRVLGVDDWGFQRKCPTGTLLVDLEKHQVVDLLMGSDERVFTAWLKEHHGVEIICRDRGASYRIGASSGAPQAQQVLDRWHLLKNWGEVMQKILGQHVEILQQASQQMKQENPSAPVKTMNRSRKAPRRTPPPPSPRAIWQAEKYQQVHALAAQGKTPAEIRERVHLCRQTVRKYLRMPTFATHYRGPISPVEPYRAYLEARWQAGEVMITRLWEELRAQGFAGSYRQVWSFVRRWPLPEGMCPTSAFASSPPPRRWSAGTRSPRQVKWLLLRKAEELSEADAVYRRALFRLAPPLSALSALGQDFVRLIQERENKNLLPWLERAKRCPFEEVQSFALGLEKEFSACQSALTEPWSTGQVEGQITKLKYLKRQMYGRANLDLLRLRMVHAA